jgi:L-serine dehydratase
MRMNGIVAGNSDITPAVSVLDLFTIGIGPSSSHTVGPMRAARLFVDQMERESVLPQTAQVEIHLFGSLALTGKGHGTDKAVLLGLEGETPETVEVESVPARLERIQTQKQLRLKGGHPVPFEAGAQLLFHRTENLPRHPNGLRFIARNAHKQVLLQKDYSSIGGGFVIEEGVATQTPIAMAELPFPCRNGEELLRHAAESGLSTSEMALRNESVWRTDNETRHRLACVWEAMRNCVQRGCRTAGTLPGGLKVQRRAPRLFRELTEQPEINLRDPLAILDWVSLWAMAVNEENAAGGRVVTAPTNGAAGILPAVLHYVVMIRGANEDQIARFLLTAGTIGILYKRNASISGAEVGCQGEVGVACSMAAGALTEILGGTVAQVENAAEIAMEHNLGLTCDPVGGLVQVPCIERNAMGAIKAINAARLACAGDGSHLVSLDKVIATMRQTGQDMSSKYKETARGGLAVNVAEC